MKMIFLTTVLLFTITVSAQNKDSLLRLIPAEKKESKRLLLIWLTIGDLGGSNDPQKALVYHKKALELTRKMHDNPGEAVVTTLWGSAIAGLGNAAGGIQLMIDGVHLAEEAGSEQALGIAYNEIGVTYLYQKDLQKAKTTLQRAITASSVAGDSLWLGAELGNLAEAYDWSGKLDSALYYNNQCLAVINAVKEKVTLPIPYYPYALARAGSIHAKQGEKEVALAFYRTALQAPYTQQNAQTKGWVLDAMANFYSSQGKMDSALYYATENVKAVSTIFFSHQLFAIHTLWQVFTKINSDSAQKYALQYYTMKDSIYNQQQLQQVQTQALLEEERQQRAKEEHHQNLQYAAIAIGIITFIIFFFVFTRSVVVNEKFISLFAVLGLLALFEFINLLIHPYLETVTHHSPVSMLLILIFIGALLVPLHHKLEHWITHKLIEKNKMIRLAAAKRTIEQLEEKNMNTNQNQAK